MQTVCTHCQASLAMPETAVGKKVRCPKCKEVFVASAGKAAPEVPASPPVQKKRPARPSDEEEPPRKRPRDADDEDEAPRRRRRDEDDEVDEDRPRRRRRDEDDDEDEDERPRRRRRVDDEEIDDDDRPRRRRRADDDEDEDRPRRRRRDDDDEDDEDDDVRGWRREADARARRAAIRLYIACGIYLINIIYGFIVSMMTINAIQAPPGLDAGAFKVGQMVGAGCVPIVYLILLLLILQGARSLAGLRSKGMVITALVLCILISLLSGGVAALNTLVLFSPIKPLGQGIIIATVVMNGINALMMLVGGVMGILALTDRNVQRAYASARRR